MLYLNLSLVSWRYVRGSPLAGSGGCSASKTAFTSVNLVNLVGNHCLEFLDFRDWPMAVYASTAMNRAVKHSQ